MDLSVSIADGLTLTCCIYNASGPRSGTAEALLKVANSSSGAVLSKSATLESQTGNPLPRTHHDDDRPPSLSFNSEGLPNRGIEYYTAEETINTALGENAGRKPYIVSLSGKTLADNLSMLRAIATAPHKNKIAAIELNLACPNVIGKPIIGYDIVQVKDALRQVDRLYAQEARQSPLPPLGVKLPPYLDTVLLSQVSEVIETYHPSCVSYIVCINTVGNTLPIDTQHSMPYIKANSGLAGLSGPSLLPIALANIRQFHQQLPRSCRIVGVGGVTTGQDVYAMLLAGATAVQVGTTHWREGPSCFDRITNELRSVLREKGHGSATEVTGTLQEWSKQPRVSKKGTIGASAGASGVAASAELTQFKLLTVVLIVVVGVLLADKFGESFL